MTKTIEKILHVVEAEQNRQGITTKELAERSGCSSRIIDFWKNGTRNMSLTMAEQVLDVLGYELIVRKK